jgi:hypothetical protein
MAYDPNDPIGVEAAAEVAGLSKFLRNVSTGKVQGANPDRIDYRDPANAPEIRTQSEAEGKAARPPRAEGNTNIRGGETPPPGEPAPVPPASKEPMSAPEPAEAEPVAETPPSEAKGAPKLVTIKTPSGDVTVTLEHALSLAARSHNLQSERQALEQARQAMVGSGVVAEFMKTATPQEVKQLQAVLERRQVVSDVDSDDIDSDGAQVPGISKDLQENINFLVQRQRQQDMLSQAQQRAQEIGETVEKEMKNYPVFKDKGVHDVAVVQMQQDLMRNFNQDLGEMVARHAATWETMSNTVRRDRGRTEGQGAPVNPGAPHAPVASQPSRSQAHTGDQLFRGDVRKAAIRFLSEAALRK